MNSADVRQFMDLLAEGDISRADAERLADCLQTQPGLVAELRADLRLVERLSQLLSSTRTTEVFVETVQTRIAAEESGNEFTNSVMAKLSNGPAAQPWRIILPVALAASLAIVAGGVWFGLRTTGVSEPLGLRVAEASGEWSVVSGQWSVGGGENIQQPTANNQQLSGTRAVVGMELRQGDRVVVKDGGKVGLKYDGEETTIELLAASEAGFGAEAGAKRVNLAAGTLVCSAAPQKMPLEIATRQAVSRVVGTRFSLTAEDVKTTLAVLEGKVALCQGEKILEVKSGETATATEEGMEMDPVLQAQARMRSGRVWVASWDWQTSRMGTPVLVKSSDGTPLSDVTAVAVGEIAVALKSDGSVWTWGPNDKGQLGDGTTTLRDSPVQVKLADGTPLANVTAIAAGKRYAVALRNDRTVWAWGSNSWGEMGDGTTSPHSCPVQVMGLSDVIAIAAGNCYALALRSDATVWAWGDNLRGVLDTGTRKSGPVQVRQRDGMVLSEVNAISAGGNHAVALKKDGSVWSWGYSVNGALGDGSSTAGRDLTGLGSGPASVGAVHARLADGTPLGGVIAIAGGFGNTVVLKADRSIWVWGKVGLRFDWQSTPVQVVLANNSPLENVTAIGAGYVPLACTAVTQDGAYWRLTGERMCQTSDGRQALQVGAVQVNEFAKVISVAGGLGRTLVLTE